MQKKLLFIVNPKAGRIKSREPLFDAVSIFCDAGYLVEVVTTRRRGDAEMYAFTRGEAFDHVVCHGGDGTLSETVNGLMRLSPDRRPALSYLPGGSTNDFAASLQISREPALAALRAMRLVPQPLDVGRFGERNFIYVASFGSFTQASYSAPQDVKNMFGHFAYFLEGVRDIESLRPYPMKITTDTGEVFEGEYLFGAVSNATSIAGIMKLEPANVDFSDGRFELILVPVPKTALGLQHLITALTTRDYANSKGLIFRHVRSLTAESPDSTPWTLDGEYAPGRERVEISIDHRGITMML